MTLHPNLRLAVVAAGLAMFASVAAAAGPVGVEHCGGRWISTSDGAAKQPFEAQMVSDALKVFLPADTAPPRGHTLLLQPAGPGVFRTAQSDEVRAEFRCLGPGRAHLDVKHISLRWTSVFSTDLKHPKEDRPSAAKVR